MAFCVAMYVYSNVDKNLGSQFLAVALDAQHVVKAATISSALRICSNSIWRLWMASSSSSRKPSDCATSIVAAR